MPDYNPKQKDLNLMISQELDYHFVQNEYGQLLLDRDTVLRNKHKWFFNTSIVVWGELGITIITAIIGALSDIKILFGVATIFFIIFLTYFILRYKYKKEIAILLPEKQREEIVSCLKSHSEYITQLRYWFMQVGANTNTKQKHLDKIETMLDEAYRKGHQDYNILGSLFGKLDESLHERAHQKAVEKLSQLKIYFI